MRRFPHALMPLLLLVALLGTAPAVARAAEGAAPDCPPGAPPGAQEEEKSDEQDVVVLKSDAVWTGRVVLEDEKVVVLERTSRNGGMSRITFEASGRVLGVAAFFSGWGCAWCLLLNSRWQHKQTRCAVTPCSGGVLLVPSSNFFLIGDDG